LRACLNHKDKDTRVMAMRTLAELGDLGCAQELIALARISDGFAQRKMRL